MPAKPPQPSVFNHHHFMPLPEPLAGLAILADDLRWTWSHAGDDLWNAVDPGIWQRTQNPYVVLQSVGSQRLQALAEDQDFCAQLSETLKERQQYMQRPGWFRETYGATSSISGIAYFSMEFGIGEALPLYAGGLGILAGDYLKSASDLQVPVVGVGLLYQQGYFRQMLDSEGWQQEFYPLSDPGSLPVEPLYRDTGEWLQVSIDLPGRALLLRIWKAKVGNVTLYLLDSNHPLNTPVDRGITAQLYGGSKEIRLLQEIVLGIGGWRVIEALGLDINICHLNEGHAAFVVLERARWCMQKHQVTAEMAWNLTRAGNVFTTHTPVAAAFDTFERELIREYGAPILKDTGISMETLLSLGRSPHSADDNGFNMAYLAMNGSLWVNGVSQLHAQVSRELFADLYPRWPIAQVPITYVTNGVHVPSWDSVWADRLWTEVAGKERWLGTLDRLSGAVEQATDESLWTFRCHGRQGLVSYARNRYSYESSLKGAGPAQLERARCVLDPNALTLGFARRFTNYKRPNLLLRQPDRLARLLSNSQRPVQIVVAGKAHPRDTEGKQMLQQWAHFMRRNDVVGKAVLLEDYDISLAQELVQGVDVWINTPRRPWEACGTSGMKVLVNGGLNLSELDGWWAEAYRPEVGWALGKNPLGCHADTGIGGRASVEMPETERNLHQDVERCREEEDQRETEELFALLEGEIIPEFFDRDQRGLPLKWIQKMRCSMAQLAPQYSANRMVREYVAELYLPAAQWLSQRMANQFQPVQAMLDWRRKLTQFWRELHFGLLEAQVDQGRLSVDVQVHLGEIPEDAVAVQLYADMIADAESTIAAGAAAEIHHLTLCDRIPGELNAFHYRVEISTQRPAQHYTLRIIPAAEWVKVPQECHRILWGPNCGAG